jgi:hypothetical protein
VTGLPRRHRRGAANSPRAVRFLGERKKEAIMSLRSRLLISAPLAASLLALPLLASPAHADWHRGGWNHRGYTHYHRGPGPVAGALVGLGIGALVGGAIAQSYAPPPPVVYAQPPAYYAPPGYYAAPPPPA